MSELMNSSFNTICTSIYNSISMYCRDGGKERNETETAEFRSFSVSSLFLYSHITVDSVQITFEHKGLPQCGCSVSKVTGLWLKCCRGHLEASSAALSVHLMTDTANGTFWSWRWSLHLRPPPRPFINMPLRDSNTSIHLPLLLALSPFLPLYMPLSPGVCVV